MTASGFATLDTNYWATDIPKKINRQPTDHVSRATNAIRSFVR
jgi:hypothetical protein